MHNRLKSAAMSATPLSPTWRSTLSSCLSGISTRGRSPMPLRTRSRIFRSSRAEWPWTTARCESDVRGRVCPSRLCRPAARSMTRSIRRRRTADAGSSTRYLQARRRGRYGIQLAPDAVERAVLRSTSDVRTAGHSARRNLEVAATHHDPITGPASTPCVSEPDLRLSWRHE